MKLPHAEFVKLKSLSMLLEFANIVARALVFLAEKSLDLKVKLTRITALIVAKKILESVKIQQSSESMNPNLLQYTMINLQKNMKNKTSKLKLEHKNPSEPIYICGFCAKEFHMPRPTRVWLHQGVCDYCNKERHICQAVEYIQCDFTVEH